MRSIEHFNVQQPKSDKYKKKKNYHNIEYILRLSK